jgi:beta-lactamase regulating signal transducer with metallopeptidase domain
MEPFANPPAASSAIGFLAALAWKSSLVLAVAWLVSLVLARRSAALRHGVWTLAVAALLALPVAQAVAPPLGAPLPFAIGPGERTVERPATPPGLPSLAPPAAAKRRAEPASPGGAASRSAAAAPTRAFGLAFAWPWLALLAWLVGATTVLVFFASGRIALARLSRRARPLADEAWHALAAEIARSLRLRRLPRFLVLADATSPLTWGVFEPTILRPARAADWPVAQRRAFLVHELAHVARRDCAIQEAAHVACALYWFHPGAWFAAHRLRVEREPACDDLVLADGAAAEAYARQLLEVVRAGRVPRAALSLSGAAMAAPSQLEARVRALLDGARDRRRIGRGRTVVAAALALVLLLPLAAVVPATSNESAHKSTKTRFAGTASPGSSELAERWERALRDGTDGAGGRGGGAFWFAYAIAFDGGRDGKETLLSDSDGWNTNDLKRGRISLADRLGCGDRDAVFLFRVPKGGMDRGIAFDRVALRNGRLSPDLGGLPVIAIGPVGLDESLDWLSARFLEAPADRRAAVLVTAISLHEGQRAGRLLEEILASPREDASRAQAAEGLARHPGPRALEVLDQSARTDGSRDVRREAAEAIGELDYGPATASLIALARELDDEIVRAEAVESLGEREPGRVVPVLVSVADEDGAEMVRREAVETLGDLPGNAGLQALRRMAQGHPDPGVRSEAVETLNEMGLRAEQAAAKRH